MRVWTIVAGDCTHTDVVHPAAPAEETNEPPDEEDGDWSTFNGCPLSGNAKQALALSLNPMKNRFESCNCKSKDPKFMDTHIGIAASPTETRENHQMIIEVTPRMRAIMAERGEDWSTETLHSTLVGKHVRITGWMLFDGEHANMAENTTPNHTGNWRATAWEIHPVTSIEMLSH